MFKYIIEDYLGLGYILSKGVLGVKEGVEKVKEKLKNGEGSDIMHVHEVLRRDRENYAKKARRDGIKTRNSKSSQKNVRRKNGHRLNCKNNRTKKRTIYEIENQ